MSSPKTEKKSLFAKKKNYSFFPFNMSLYTIIKFFSKMNTFIWFNYIIYVLITNIINGCDYSNVMMNGVQCVNFNFTYFILSYIEFIINIVMIIVCATLINICAYIFQLYIKDNNSEYIAIFYKNNINSLNSFQAVFIVCESLTIFTFYCSISVLKYFFGIQYGFLVLFTIFCVSHLVMYIVITTWKVLYKFTIMNKMVSFNMYSNLLENNKVWNII